jgi:hypothetical protein
MFVRASSQDKSSESPLLPAAERPKMRSERMTAQNEAERTLFKIRKRVAFPARIALPANPTLRSTFLSR